MLTAIQHYATRSHLDLARDTMATIMASAIPPAVMASINGVNQSVAPPSPPPAPRLDIRV